jgi:hypothetical protein
MTNLTALNPSETALGYNLLTAAEPALLAFLESKDADWDATQTVPPMNFQTPSTTTTSVTLTWTPIIYTGDGGYYVISYTTTPGGPYTVAGQTADKSASSYTVDGLTTGTPYSFVVQSYTPAHPGQQSNLLSSYSQEITVTPITHLNTPTLTLPANNSTTTNSRPAFTWGAVSQADHYELQIGTNLPLNTEPFVVTLPQFTPPSAWVAHTYYWRVRAVDASGDNASLWSDTWTVTLESSLTASAQRNLYTTSTPTLSWSSVSWAAGYELQIATADTFTENVLVYSDDQIPVGTLFVTLPALRNGTYYWRVRALPNGGSPGAWSDVNSFAVDVP